MAKVGVIILNYKVKELTLKCLSSVRKSSLKDLEVIILDNGSNDGLEKELSKDVLFIQNNENLGYTGNNVGIKKALGDGCEYVLILNPDTIIEKDTIELLVKGMEAHHADIASPKIYFSDSKKIWFAGGIFDKENVLGSNRGVDEQDHGQYDGDIEMELATGAALMVKKEVFTSIGLLDECYFLYYEDTDFCYRAKQHGFKIMYIAKAVVYHANAKSTGLGSSLQDYFITRNRMLFASKFLPFMTRFALFREALRNFGNPVRRMAFLDFLTGNNGKGSFLK